MTEHNPNDQCNVTAAYIYDHNGLIAYDFITKEELLSFTKNEGENIYCGVTITDLGLDEIRERVAYGKFDAEDGLLSGIGNDGKYTIFSLCSPNPPAVELDFVETIEKTVDCDDAQLANVEASPQQVFTYGTPLTTLSDTSDTSDTELNNHNNDNSVVNIVYGISSGVIIITISMIILSALSCIIIPQTKYEVGFLVKKVDKNKELNTDQEKAEYYAELISNPKIQENYKKALKVADTLEKARHYLIAHSLKERIKRFFGLSKIPVSLEERDIYTNIQEHSV